MISKIRNWAVLNPLARLALAAVVGIILTDCGFGRERQMTVLLMAAASSLLVLVRPRWFPLEIPAALVFATIHQVRLHETIDHLLQTELRGKERVEATVVAYITPAVEAGAGGDGRRQQITVDASSIEMPGEGRRLTGAARLRGWMTSKERLPPAGT